MVTETNEVIVIVEGHESLCLNLWEREQVLQDVRDPLAKVRVEPIEDHVRICLGHWVNLIFQIMSQNNIGQSKVCGRSIWEMAYNKSVGLTTSFMQQDDVGEVVRLRDLDEVLEDVATSVDSYRVGDNDLDFLLELGEPLARTPRSSDQDLGIAILRHFIFIINMGSSRYSLVICQFQLTRDLVFLTSKFIRQLLLIL